MNLFYLALLRPGKEITTCSLIIHSQMWHAELTNGAGAASVVAQFEDQLRYEAAAATSVVKVLYMPCLSF